MRKVGSHQTPDQERDITLRRSRLQEQVDAFQKQVAKMYDNGEDSWDDVPASEIYVGAEFDGIGEEGDDERASSSEAAEKRHQFLADDSSESCIDAEHIALHLPSHLGRTWCNNNGSEDLAKAELRLREGQLNDALHNIRIALGHKSYLFRNDVRPARTQRLKTRAWAEVHAVESTVQHYAWVYMRARKAIEDLGADALLLDRYKVLKRQDLSVKTSIIASHVRGQRNKSLAWFWRMNVRRDEADASDTFVGEWMKDCTCFPFHRRIKKCNLLYSLSCTLAEGEGSKDAMDRRASVSPS